MIVRTPMRSAALLTAALGASVSGTSAQATDFVWSLGGNGDWTDPANWTPNGDPNSLTDNVEIDPVTGVIVSLGPNLTRNVNDLTIGAGNELRMVNNTFLEIGGSVFNDGLISLNATTSPTRFRLDGSDLVLNGSGVLRLGASINNIIDDTSGIMLLTNSANHTIEGGGRVGLNTINLNNAGLIDANLAGVLMQIDPSSGGMVNTGTMRATNGGVLGLVGGVYTNTGGLILADGNDGGTNVSTVQIESGVDILGGTLQSLNGGIVRTASSTSVLLDSVTINGGLVIGNAADLDVSNTLTNTGAITFDATTTLTELVLQTDLTLNGGGTITLSDPGSPGAVNGFSQIRDEGSGVRRLTIVDQTLQGAGNIGTDSLAITLASGNTINANVTGSTLFVDPTDAVPTGGGTTGFTNNGLLQASNGGILDLAAGLYTNNTTIQADGAGSVVSLSSGVDIVGGTLQSVNGGLVRTESSTTVSLDGVTLNGGLVIGNAADLDVFNTLTNTGEITFDATTTNTEIVLQTDVTLNGGGTITLSDPGDPGAVNGFSQIRDESSVVSRLTIADQTLQGAGNIGTNTVAITLDAGNLIDANVTGATLFIDPADAEPTDEGTTGLINNGLMQASNGGILDLVGGLYTNNTTIQADGVGSVVSLSTSVDIVGGTLQSVNGGLVRTESSTSVSLDGVTLNGGLVIGNAADLDVFNTLTNTGQITFDATTTNTEIVFKTDATLNGGGTITLSDPGDPGAVNGFSQIRDEGSDVLRLTIADQTLEGAGNIGANTLAITLDAGNVIDANVTGVTLNIDPADTAPSDGGTTGLINNGLMQASNGGIMDLAPGEYLNNTTIQADGAGSLLSLSTGVDITGGVVQGVNGGLVRTESSTTVSFDNVTLNGNLVIGNAADLDVFNTLTNTGEITFDATTTNTEIVLQTDVTLNGGGTITLSDPGNPGAVNGFSQIRDESGTVRRLTIADQTLQGAGNIGANTVAITVEENGLIDANVDGVTLTIDPTDLAVSSGGATGFVSAGTLRASNGGRALLNGGSYTNNGVFEALDGSQIEAGSGFVLTNLNTGTLTGGTYRAVETGNGATMTLLGTAVDTLAATTTVELSGANASITFGGTAVQDALTTNSGTLKIFDGHVFNAANTLQNNGTIQLGGAGLTGGTLTTPGPINNAANAEILGHGTVNNTILNAGMVRAANGTLVVNGAGIDGQSGTVQIDAGASLDLSGASAASDADFLVHNGNGLNLGANNFLVREDYTNANFGIGNSFNHRANVTGSGLILASPGVSQEITGDATGGTTATATLALGNIRVGDSVSGVYKVKNAGATGPVLRGALQTNNAAGNGGNITDARLSGAGVTAANYGPLDNDTETADLGVTFTGTTAGALTGQQVAVVNNFDNVANQTITVTGAAYNAAVADVSPTTVNLGNFHVGDAVTPQAIAISNNAPAGAFSEDLLADNLNFTGDAVGGGPGSVQVIAGGSNSDVTLGVSTASAGNKAGNLSIDLTSTGEVNGVNITGIDPLSLGSQDVGVTATVYRFAGFNLPSEPTDLGEFHVGDAASGSIVVENDAIADGFSEDLQVAVSGFAPSVTAASGDTTVAAGANSGNAITASLSTANAGDISGTVTLQRTSLAAAAGLTDTDQGTSDATVTATVFNLAEATINNAQPIDFGFVHVGDVVTAEALSISNSADAGAFSEGLDAAFGVAGAGITTNGGSIDNLVAGGTNNASLTVGINTGTAGVINGNVAVDFTSDGDGINSLGQTGLASQNVGVQATVIRFAEANVPTDPTDLGEFHVGDVATGSIVVENTAVADGFSESLEAEVTGFSADVIAASGTATAAAGGDTGSALTASLSTANAGDISGTVDIGLTSLSGGAGLSDTDQGSTTAEVTAKVFRLADPTVNTNTVDFGIVHVGDVVSAESVSVTNSAADDGFSEGLDAAFGGTPVGITGAGFINDLGAQGTDAASLMLTLDTSIARVINGNADIDFTSDGNGVNSLGQTALASEDIQIIAQVNEFAAPVFIKDSGDGDFEMLDDTTYTLDFGLVDLDTVLVTDLDLLNDVDAPADTLAGTFTLAGAAYSFTNFDAFSDIAAGEALDDLMLALDTSELGVFTGSIVLSGRSQNASGFDGALADITITITGEVVPEPTTAGILLVGALFGIRRRR